MRDLYLCTLVSDLFFVIYVVLPGSLNKVLNAGYGIGTLIYFNFPKCFLFKGQ